LSGTIDIEFSVRQREFKLKMLYDAEFQSDHDMLHEFRARGCCEPEVTHAMVRCVRPGDFVIDGGANTGVFTLILSQLVGDTGEVLAVEPSQNNIWKLEENIRINKAKNVHIERKPLWSKEDKVKLHMTKHSGRNSLARNGETMAVVTMDAISLDMLDPIPRLIKLDIEGAEEAALRGASRFLYEQACPFIVCELNDGALNRLGTSQGKLRGYMREHGYGTFLLHDNGFLPTYVPRDTVIKSQRANVNILFSTHEKVSEAWPEVVV
jgi:FkbM family methyltransferase